VTCTVVQEREQPRLYDVVSREVRAGSAFAVLDPTWPQPFSSMASSQVAAAASGGMVGRGDMVVFSSGSTGRPRGIVRTVQSWQVSVASFSDITGITHTDTVWLPGPLWSSLFLYGAFHAGAVGAQVILLDDDRDESAGATVLHCVPSQLPGLLQRAGAGGLPLVRVAVVAGDHCAAPLREQCEAAGWRVVEYYGAAELSFVAWRDDKGPFRVFPGVETELRDGLLWSRSPYLARGYLTPDTQGPFRLDPQGWATVGDLAREAAGGLEILGRGNTAVTSGGHTVVVEEVERLLQGLPGVLEVAVLGVPHPRLGQALTAVVVGSAVDATLRAAVAGMPAPSRPRRWVHADSLPRTSGGKLRRDALPDLVAKLKA
jgi:long-chain acyl-CoA synthetase